MTTSTAGSSAPLTSLDGELPDLNLDNATVDFEGDGGLSFGFDRIWGNFYKEQYLYQVGINFFDGIDVETANNWNKGTVGFVVYNFETNEIDYEFTLNPGQTYIDAVVNDGANPLGNNSYSAIEIYEGYLYILFDYFQVANNILQLAGDYQPIVDYLTSEGINYTNNAFNLLLRFDLTQPGDYEIIFIKTSDSYANVTSITFNNDELHVLSNNSNQAGYSVAENISFFDAFDLPETIINNEPYISYTIHPMTDGTTIGKQRYETFFEAESTSSRYYLQYARFLSISEGLVYKNFDENGNPFITLNGYLSALVAVNITNISEKIDELTSLSGVSATDLSNIKASLQGFYDEIRDDEYITDTDSIFVQFGYSGLFSVEISEFDFAAHTNSWLNIMSNEILEDNQYFQSNFYTSIVKIDDTYILTSTFTQFVYGNIVVYTNIYDNEGTIIVDNFTSVKQFDNTNKTFTPIELSRDDLYTIAGIYPREGGYYLSGSVLENDTNGVEGLAAGLFLLDENFQVEDFLLLDGSRTDIGNILTINSSGRIIWIIYSSSTDGDFAGAAASNTTFISKQYAVFF